MLAVLIAYWVAVLGLMLYGINCFVLLHRFHRNRPRALARLEEVRCRWRERTSEAELPFVTVQLPIFNERFVVGRLLHAVAGLDYPRDRLEVQLLDDSTDDTAEIAAEIVAPLREQGLEIAHLRRAHRDGFKAGALRDATRAARGALIAIFDADFVPMPDFLRQTVPFFEDPRVGLVQARWSHINPDSSALTRAQAIAIDGHFSIEQAGRAWGGFFLNFNGTAGVWRRATIDDAGGWLADTLTEDLDLSYRAQLRGWHVEYAIDVSVPAEIPEDLAAFKSQQRRWAKGSIQTAIKLLPRVLVARVPAGVKAQAAIHLTHYLVHPLMLLICILSVPLLWAWEGITWSLPFVWLVAGMLVGSTGPSALYLAAQRVLQRNLPRTLLAMPTLLALGTGIALSNSIAVVEGVLGVRSPFVRTPKTSAAVREKGANASCYRLRVGPIVVGELALAAYSAVGLALHVHSGKVLIGPFLALYTAGFLFVAVRSLAEQLRGRECPSLPEREFDRPAASRAEYLRVLDQAAPPRHGKARDARWHTTSTTTASS